MQAQSLQLRLLVNYKGEFKKQISLRFSKYMSSGSINLSFPISIKVKKMKRDHPRV
jgi:hypothetical protein